MSERSEVIAQAPGEAADDDERRRAGVSARTPVGAGALVGPVVRLDPLVASDASALFSALDDARVYASGYSAGVIGRPSSVAAMADSLVASALRDQAAGTRQCYTVRLASGEVVGTSSLGDVELYDGRIHLGWTAYAPSVWGGAVNPACKLLLLKHAFETLGFGRVKIQTDIMNLRSQAAIAGLGAVREGVMRRHKVRPDGSFRDTVVFSVLDVEWPAVKAGLERRIQPRPDGAAVAGHV